MTNIVLDRKEFIKVLGIGGMFAGKKGKVLPILDCVKMKVSGGRLNVVSSDGENAINKKMDVVESDGDSIFCVGYKELLSYVKLVSGDNITLCVGDTDVTIKHPKGEMSLPIFDADNFPTIKPDEESKTITMDSALLNNWIVDARVYTGDDEIRVVMSGIYFYSKDGEIGCCGSDGRMLFTDYRKSDYENFEFILNKNAFAAVCGICSESENVTLRIGERNVLFIGNDMSVLTRCLEFRYPSFKLVIPTDNHIKAVADKNELIEAIKRCRLSANKSTMMIKMEFSGMELKLTGQDFDFNRKATETLMVQTDGNVTIGFNAEQLLSVLETVGTDRVIMEMKDGTRPCIVKEDNDCNKTIIICPVLVD